MSDTIDSKPLILANILLALGGLAAIIGGISHPDLVGSALPMVLLVVGVAFGARFTRVCLPLLALVDMVVVYWFFA